MNLLPPGPARLVAQAAGWLSRRTGRGGGTTVPGVVLLRLRPDAVAELARPLARSIVISATNGKTTTARLVAAAVEATGASVVANTAGSNLERGVAAALLDAGRHARDATGVFEVDEAALPTVVAGLEPDVIVLGNLLRDQLDRYGELETLAQRWTDLVDRLDGSTTLVLDADDPAVAELAHHHDDVITFGVDDPTAARAGLAHAADAITCRACGTPLTYDHVFLAHLGHWRCPTGDRARPAPDVSVRSFRPRAVDGSSLVVDVAGTEVALEVDLPGLHNAYNVAAALGAATSLDLDPAAAAAAMETTDAAFGRGERVTVDGHDLMILLAKNPAGVNENVRTLLLVPEPVDVVIQLNDRTADGRDVSWIWDVDYEDVFDHLRSVTLTGDRAYDLALRFRYGGFPTDRLTVEPSPAAALDVALAGLAPGAPLFALPTYTSMLELRAELVRRGVADDFWNDR